MKEFKIVLVFGVLSVLALKGYYFFSDMGSFSRDPSSPNPFVVMVFGIIWLSGGLLYPLIEAISKIFGWG